MRTVLALTLLAAAFAARPALADRPFGSSNQGPPAHLSVQANHDGGAASGR